MFLLTENELPMPLKDIGAINVTLFHSCNELFNFFNLEYPFNENSIPLITSVLECQPEYYIRKIYNHLNYKTIIEYQLNNPVWNNFTHTREFGNSLVKSFYLDIENYNTSGNHIYNDKKQLVSSITYSDSNELVRIYSRDTRDTRDARDVRNIGEKVINCNMNHIVSWKLGECIVELIIRSSSSEVHKCRLELIINVTEENNFISTKMDHANTILEKLHKIKSSLITD